ncbi:MAG TPA: CDP-glucose 4,6-dehydratase [Rectinemataceae bacterium]|nr:CDP-glucose 4,6-dehydratase [Rectinemataceae bacterium]
MIDPSFWRKKRVFITGHTGFKGSWLSQWLLMLGAEVRGYALDPPTEPSLFVALGLAGELDHCLGDIRNAEALESAMKNFKPEIVFHLAAQPLVRLSYKEPRLTYETNVMGTLNVYEAVRTCQSVQVVVSITTDKCYENREWVWGYRENDAMGGYDPYSSSKGCAEILSAAYRRSFFNSELYGRTHQVALATARAGNVIGGGDWALDRLIPDCVRFLSKGETIFIRNPTATRPWQHVLEPLSGYLCLAQKMVEDPIHSSEGWNFGPNDDGVWTVEAVVTETVKAWGSGHYEVIANPDLHEATVLKLDVSKARTKLKWASHMTTVEAIRSSIAVYRRFYENAKTIVELVRDQISQYAKDVR